MRNPTRAAGGSPPADAASTWGEGRRFRVSPPSTRGDPSWSSPSRGAREGLPSCCPREGDLPSRPATYGPLGCGLSPCFTPMRRVSSPSACRSPLSLTSTDPSLVAGGSLRCLHPIAVSVPKAVMHVDPQMVPVSKGVRQRRSPLVSQLRAQSRDSCLPDSSRRRVPRGDGPPRG